MKLIGVAGASLVASRLLPEGARKRTPEYRTIEVGKVKFQMVDGVLTDMKDGRTGEYGRVHIWDARREGEQVLVTRESLSGLDRIPSGTVGSIVSVETDITTIESPDTREVLHKGGSVYVHMRIDGEGGNSDERWVLARNTALVDNPQVVLGSEPVDYTVQPGDTLWYLARRFRLPAEEIVETNDLANPNLILSGQRLTLPLRMEVIDLSE